MTWRLQNTSADGMPIWRKRQSWNSDYKYAVCVPLARQQEFHLDKPLSNDQTYDDSTLQGQPFPCSQQQHTTYVVRIKTAGVVPYHISSLFKDLLLGGPRGSTDLEKIVRSIGNGSDGKSTRGCGGCWEGGESVCGIDRCKVVSEFTCGWHGAGEIEANGPESDSELGSDGGGDFANGQQLELAWI